MANGFLGTQILKGYFVADAFEAAIGAFIPMLYFFVIRDDPGPFFNPIFGFIVMILILFLIIKFVEPIDNTHLFLDLLVIGAMSVVFVLQLGLATTDQLNGFQFFGSPAVVGIWLGLGAGLAFDAFNVKSIIATRFVRREGGV